MKSIVVKCVCGNIFKTLKEKTQCGQCGKRFVTNERLIKA